VRRNRPGLTWQETKVIEWREYLEEVEGKHPGVLCIVDIFEVEV
jgi:hypothetical protein